MQTVSFRIWTQVTMSISYDNDYYTISAPAYKDVLIVTNKYT